MNIQRRSGNNSLTKVLKTNTCNFGRLNYNYDRKINDPAYADFYIKVKIELKFLLFDKTFLNREFN